MPIGKLHYTAKTYRISLVDDFDRKPIDSTNTLFRGFGEQDSLSVRL